MPEQFTDKVQILKNGVTTIELDGTTGNIIAGGNGQDGDIVLRSGTGQNTILLDGGAGDMMIGGGGQPGNLSIRNQAGKRMIHLDGNTGDIILENADCAEDFDIAVGAAFDPGTVMVLDDTGALCAGSTPYDRRVAGVVSGAGEHRPGIILDKQAGQGHRQPVALVGKVFCKADARYGAITVGDLLTTSPTPGHAMKVSDHTQALGAILGKALRPLPSGTGMIPILVALQ